MDYRCISADSHIDLCWLPHDLFTSSAARAMKDRMPYVTQGPDGPRWVTKAGRNLGFANGVGGTGAMASGRKYIGGEEHRIDRMATTGLFADGAQGICRPATPELRLQDQERDGIQAEVMYGLHRAGEKLMDRDATVEFYRIYNEWLSGFCSYDHRRLVGLATIPSQSVEAAVAETRRVAKLGLGGLDVRASWDMIPLWNPYWDPLWQTAVEVNLPVHFHSIGQPPAAAVPEDLANTYKQAAMASQTVGFQLSIAALLTALINGGALERYPTLRIVLGESGIGWIPYVLERMDEEYKNRFRRGLPLKMKPSEYWRRQCRATFQNDVIGIVLLDRLGVETVMWASDYPHPDGVFPDSQEHIKRQFGDLPNAVQRKITCENAGKFYGLIPA